MDMKKKIALFVAMIVLGLSAKAPAEDKHEFLQSKVDEAANMCRQNITDTAKDPTTLQFAEKYNYGFGRVVTRNWIFIYWDVMGKNTYGALLKHSITCTVSCTQKKGCSLIGTEE